MGHTYEVAVVARDKAGNTQDIESAPHGVVTIYGKTLTPNIPTDLTATPAMHTIFLQWVNPLDADLAEVEVWRNDTDTQPNPAMASTNRIALVTANHYADNLGDAGITMYYWVRARNASGYYSDFNALAGVVATSEGVTATSIDDFAVTATKLFLNTVVLANDVWTNSSPSAGYIAWNAHTIVYGGASYAISAGNTNLEYVAWVVGASTYTASATHPTAGFTIAHNAAGIHTLVWNNSANMVIGSAFIGSLDAGKITSGTLSTAYTAAKCTNALADQTSANTAADTAKVQGYTLITGGYIKADYITADNIQAGTLNASIVDITNLSANSINAGTLSADRIAAGSIAAAKLSSDVISGGKIIAGLLTADNIQTGTLTGRTIQTAASGTRIELAPNGDSTTIKFYYQAGATALATVGAGSGKGLVQTTDGTHYAKLWSDGQIQAYGPGIFSEAQSGSYALDLRATDAYVIRAVGATAGVNVFILNYDGSIGTLGTVNTSEYYKVDGTKVVGNQGAAVADATGAGDVVAQLNTLLARCRTHGLIAS